MNPFQPPMAPGVSVNKKADLDALTRQITVATAAVADWQNVVTALTAKSTQFAGYLANADANRNAALTNLNLMRDAAGSSVQLQQTSELAQKQTNRAVDKIGLASAQVADLIYKLIFSCELVDKLAQLVNKQKLINPTIPDDLIKYLGKATADANTAMAATLTAMSSCYAAEATGLESKEAMQLIVKQIQNLYAQVMASAPAAQNKKQETPTDLMSMFEYNYQTALTDYQSALTANTAVSQQLAHAQLSLSNATSVLNSVKLGLAAATAAAFAA